MVKIEPMANIWSLICFIASVSLAQAAGLSEMSAKLHDDKPYKDANCRGFDAKRYPAPKSVNRNCFTGNGRDFRGSQSTSRDGRTCSNWREYGGTFWGEARLRRQYGIGDHNFCRNPDQTYNGGPWCFVDVGVFSRCDIPACQNYVRDPLENLPTKMCDNNKVEFIFPDVMYSFGGHVFYATRKTNTYVIYKFRDGNMTSLGDPPIQTIGEAWNFCIQHNDTITFATSYKGHLYVYFENQKVMIKIGFSPNADWREVDSSVHRECTLKEPTPTSSNNVPHTSTRQVFSVNEPNVVLLLRRNEMIRCEWDDGVLKYVKSTQSQFGICPSGSLHFIDGDNKNFQIYGPSSAVDKGPPSTEDVIRSTLTAVDKKPALAFPLLGYDVLNQKSLVKIQRLGKQDHALGSCSSDGARSRMYQLYDGDHLKDLIGWLNNSIARETWIRVHDLQIRKSSFCERVENASCCSDVARQVLDQQLERNFTEYTSECRNEMFFVYCKVSFPQSSSACPFISCTNDEEDLLHDEQAAAVCEIALESDPPCSVSLDDILQPAEEGISYKDAGEAVNKMDAIAATINYQSKNDTKVLSTLVNSVQALENVNYSSLSRTGAENLISDIVNVVDNIVDDERADVWVSLQEENDFDVFNGSVSSGNITSVKREKASSPSDMLFSMESILGGIVSGQVWNDLSNENSNFSMAFSSKNVISTIQSLSEDFSAHDVGGNIFKFDCAEMKSGRRTLTIVSKYPKLMRLISHIDRARVDNSPSCEGNDCEMSRKKNFEYISHSPVLSASVVNDGHKVSSGVTFAIPFEEQDIPDPHLRDSKFYFSCRYLSDDKETSKNGQWDESGCRVTKVDHVEKLVYCSCNHTTNFAILLQVVPPKIQKEDLTNLQLIAYIGESISVFCLLVTLITFIIFRHSLKSARMVAHFHLVIALIIFHTTQLMVVLAEKEKSFSFSPCIAVTVLTHFSLLASFCWMLVEGILLHLSVVSVFHSMKNMNVLRYVLGWVLPGIISGITAVYGLTKYPYPTCYLEGVGEMSCPPRTRDSQAYLENELFGANTDAQPNVQLVEWCWLSSTNYLVWAMAAPAILGILINSIVLARVSWVIAQTAKSTNMYRPTTQQKKEKHIRKCLKGAVILMPILGTPWVFGLIPQAASHVGLLYTFTILNSLQGFFILLFYCVLSSEVRSAFSRCVRKRSMLYSQNWSTNTSGRHSPGEYKCDSKRSKKKTRNTSATALLKNDEMLSAKEVHSFPTSTPSAGKDKSDEVFTDISVKYMNNNTSKKTLQSETSV